MGDGFLKYVIWIVVSRGQYSDDQDDQNLHHNLQRFQIFTHQF